MQNPATNKTSERTGFFLVFEGGDGAGKTTQVKLAAEWFKKQGRKTLCTREPGGTQLGKTLRQQLLHGDEITDRTEALLYAADRAQHITQIVRPALAKGVCVIQDRYIDSSVAYQGNGRMLGANKIKELNMWACDGLQPHLTVLLDLNADVAVKRMTLRGEATDRLEREGYAFHHRVREGFLQLAAADSEKYFVIDAEASAQHIHERVIERILEQFTENNTSQNN